MDRVLLIPPSDAARRAMYLVEILLPTSCKDGAQVQQGLFRAVQEHLIDIFGGVTAFVRSPGDGAWRNEGNVQKDKIVVLEVMAREIDEVWWRHYRSELERSFRQQEIVIRSHLIRLL